MSDYLPRELVIEILKRLPIKPLLQFTLVSKSWHSLITHPTFISTHLKHTIKTKNTPLLLRHYSTYDIAEHYTFLHEDHQTLAGFNFSELEFPCKTQLGYCRIVGSCHGLICLCNDLFGNDDSVILWNPSIRKWVLLPKPRKPDVPHMVVLGFGVDPMTFDFKVVRLVYYRESITRYIVPPSVEIFTLSKGSWRSMNCGAAPWYGIVEFMWSQVLVNDVVHWIAYNPCFELGFRSLILSFDMGTELFDEIMLPESLAGEFATNLSLSVFEESLTVIKYDKEIDTVSCCVWVMKEYGVAKSWTRLFTIDQVLLLERIVGFSKNGEALLSLSSGKLVAYDPKTGLVKDLEIFGTSRSFHVDTCMETLTFIGGQNRISDG